MRIQSQGLIRSPETTLALNQIVSRVIDRYKFAPTYFEKIQIKYSTGFSLEVGDVLPFGGVAAKIIDLNTGLRGTEEQLFEVINKSLNIETGDISVDLLSTSFSINVRNAVVAPTAGCGDNSSNARLELINIVNTGEFINEAEKWLPFIDQNVRVYSADYTQDEVVVFEGIDPADDNFMLVSPALSFTPNSNHSIGLPEYNESSSVIDSVYKLQFVFNGARPVITGVASADTFNVDDATKLVVGSEVVINSPDFTRDSFGTKILIENIVGNTVTLDQDLTFTPLIGDFVNNSDFLDGGFIYTVI